VSGLVAAACITPSNAVFDKTVIEFANGKCTMWEGIRKGFGQMIKEPGVFFTSFKVKWIYFVYGSTYMVNNISDEKQWITGVPVEIQSLLVTFAVNTGVGIPKDKAFAQAFGAIEERPFPLRALALYVVRDIITIASAFTFPKMISRWLIKEHGYKKRRAEVTAQIASPLLVQALVTPLHLLGLDIYNRKGKPIKDRLKLVIKQYPQSAGLRMARFLPAYGFGGVVNR
jgi:hypothetical protein